MTTKQQNKDVRYEKARSFFRGNTWKQILAFSFFLLMAFGFWLLQYLQQRFEIEMSIPLKYENIPAEFVLNDSLPDEIKLRVFDKGTVLLSYTFSKKIDPIKINLKKMKPEGDHYLIPGAILDKEISKRLLVSTTLQGYSPEKLIIGYHPLTKKEVSVVVDGNISPAAGYMFVDSLHIDPFHVSVFGRDQVVDTIQVIYTEPVEMLNLSKPFEKRVKLLFPKGLNSDQKDVLLSGKIEEFTEKTFTMPVVCENLPEIYILRLFPSTVEVTCQMALSKYSLLTADSLAVNIDYNELIGNKTYSFPAKLSKRPDWVKNYRISPEKIEFLIEKKRDHD